MSFIFRREGRRERAAFLSQKREYNGKIKRAIRQVRRDYRHLKPSIVDQKFFGAPHIDPQHLTIYLFFKDEAALAEARQQGTTQLLQGALISALRAECYPQGSLAGIKILFASKKAVKDAGGFWTYIH